MKIRFNTYNFDGYAFRSYIEIPVKDIYYVRELNENEKLQAKKLFPKEDVDKMTIVHLNEDMQRPILIKGKCIEISKIYSALLTSKKINNNYVHHFNGN